MYNSSIVRHIAISGVCANFLSNQIASDNFVQYQLKSWQWNYTATHSSPPCIWKFGSSLGPHPIVILDHVHHHSHSSSPDVPPPDSSIDRVANEFKPLANELQWTHGMIYIPLLFELPHHSLSSDGSAAIPENGHLTSWIQLVRNILDGLNVRWAHFLARGVGALILVRMLSSGDHAKLLLKSKSEWERISSYSKIYHGHIIGTWTLLDTPIITPSMTYESLVHEQLESLQNDINLEPIHLARLSSFAIHCFLRVKHQHSVLSSLSNSSELNDKMPKKLVTPWPIRGFASLANKGLISDVYDPLYFTTSIFHPDIRYPVVSQEQWDQMPHVIHRVAEYLSQKYNLPHKDRGRGLILCTSEYTSVRSISRIRHPTLIVQPMSGGFLSGVHKIHQSMFGVSKTTSIKAANSHEELFQKKEAAKELAGSLRHFLKRYEIDDIIARQFQKKIEEMKKLMSETKNDVVAVKSSSEKSKKGKKKK